MSPRSRLALAVMAAAALASPATPAHAKGIASVSVCGADGCTTLASAEKRSAACPECSAEELLTALPGSAHPTRRAPYVRIVLSFEEPGGDVVGSERVLFSPSLGLAARPGRPGEWAWFEPGPAALEIATSLARGVRPYAAAGMPLDRAPQSAAATAAQRPDAGDSSAPAIIAGGAILAVALGLVAVATRRRRRRPPVLGGAT